MSRDSRSNSFEGRKSPYNPKNAKDRLKNILPSMNVPIAGQIVPPLWNRKKKGQYPSRNVAKPHPSNAKSGRPHENKKMIFNNNSPVPQQELQNASMMSSTSNSKTDSTMTALSKSIMQLIKPEKERPPSPPKIMIPMEPPKKPRVKRVVVKSKCPVVIVNDIKFEESRARRLDGFEKEMDAVEKVHQELKMSVRRSINVQDHASELMASHMLTIDEIRTYLKHRSSAIDTFEETTHKSHLESLTIVTEQIDKIRDQCRNIREQVRKQREEIDGFHKLTFSRSVYIFLAFLLECIIWVFIGISTLIEKLTGYKATNKVKKLTKWPASMAALRLKYHIVIPTMNGNKLPSKSNAKVT